MINLVAADLRAIDIQLTDENGNYEFDNVPARTDVVVVLSLDQPRLLGWTPTRTTSANSADSSQLCRNSDGALRSIAGRSTLVSQLRTGEPASVSTCQADFGLVDCDATDPNGGVAGSGSAKLTFSVLNVSKFLRVPSLRDIDWFLTPASKGDAPRDFGSSSALHVRVADTPNALFCGQSGCDDTLRDVGVPFSLAGRTSGWDMRALFVSYSPVADELFVGIDW